MFDALVARIRRWRMKIIKPFGAAKSDLKISICDENIDVAHALATAFGDAPAVEVVAGNLLDLASDAIVSPANSFGDMGGGLDKAIDDYYRGEAQRRLVAAIAERHCGELPVGCALVIALPTGRFPFLIAAPTMRIPSRIQNSINAYLSMRALLVAIIQHNKVHAAQIHSVAIPGLGTGVGGMVYQEAAAQMRMAYDNVVGEKWRAIVHPAQAPYAFHPEYPTAKWV